MTRALAAIVLRLLLGFAFVPAGIKKLLGEPFTDPRNTGAFHEFLHAFHATGGFYRAVGVLQLVAAVLLMTQRYALAGALVALPIQAAIVALCWSTGVYPTASIATLMLAGTCALLWHDRAAWRGAVQPIAVPAGIDLRLWSACGAAVFVAYVATCLALGEVYRPKGARPDEPGFYLFPVLLLLPIATWAIDRRRRRRALSAARPSG